MSVPAQQAATVEWRSTSRLRAHGHPYLLPPLPTAAYESFRQDIARRGITNPLEITSEGIVLDGRERLRAARSLGIEQLPVRIVTPKDEVEHILLAALQ